MLAPLLCYFFSIIAEQEKHLINDYLVTVSNITERCKDMS